MIKINRKMVIGVAKVLASGTVAIGTMKIVADTIKAVANPTSRAMSVAVTAASFVIGAKAADVASDATNEMIDEAVDNFDKGWAKLKVKLEESKLELEIENLRIERVRRLNRVNKGVSTLDDEGLTEGVDIRKNEHDKWVYINEFVAPTVDTVK